MDVPGFITVDFSGYFDVTDIFNIQEDGVVFTISLTYSLTKSGQRGESCKCHEHDLISTVLWNNFKHFLRQYKTAFNLTHFQNLPVSTLLSPMIPITMKPLQCLLG